MVLYSAVRIKNSNWKFKSKTREYCGVFINTLRRSPVVDTVVACHMLRVDRWQIEKHGEFWLGNVQIGCWGESWGKSGSCHIYVLNKIYRVIRNDFRGFDNLSYTIHLR
jgi:hypothetical protein